MKTAKIESYRLTFVSYRFTTEVIGIESFCNIHSFHTDFLPNSYYIDFKLLNRIVSYRNRTVSP